VQKFAFSTDALPLGLSDRQRFDEWQRMVATFYAELGMETAPDVPFQARVEGVALGSFSIGRFNGSMSRVERTPRQVAQDANDDYIVGINLTSNPLRHAQARYDHVIKPGAGEFCTNGEAGFIEFDGAHNWLFLGMPRAVLHEIYPAAENLLGKPLDASNPGLQHLKAYMAMLFSPGSLTNNPDLAHHIEMTLADLVALTLGIEGDMQHITRLGGVRAGHLRDILREIKANFDRPEFSVDDVCRKLKLSPRYLQCLLVEAQTSFTEQVIEFRLVKAQTMLASRRCLHLQIGEIAYLCGFNEVPYFNRRFKARFGCSPGEVRHANGNA